MNISIKGILADKVYQITMDDGSVWQIPLIIIAMSHARYYAEVDEKDFQDALREDTAPLFDADDYEAEDWAKNNMDWDDVVGNAIMVKGPSATDHQEGWVNGEAEVCTI